MGSGPIVGNYILLCRYFFNLFVCLNDIEEEKRLLLIFYVCMQLFLFAYLNLYEACAIMNNRL